MRSLGANTLMAREKGTNLVRVLYIVFATLMALFGLIFHLRNDQVVILNYYTGRLETQLSLVVVSAIIFGVLLGLLVMSVTVLRLKREVRRNNKIRRELASIQMKSSGKDVR